MRKRIVYSCQTLKNELLLTAKEVGFEGDIHFLDVSLHSNPQKMHQVLQQHIDENTDAEEILICVSGCGKSTLGLKATTADVILPRTMDCIDILLSGSGIERPQGAIFMTKSWMEFSKASAICHEKMIHERGYEEAAAVLRKLYKGFNEFYIIDTGTYDTKVVEEYITPLVKILDGKIEYLPGKYGVLKKLLSGNYDRDLIHIAKGNSVDISEFAGLCPAVIK